MLNDRVTARLVEQNCLAYRLFSKPATPPAGRPEAATTGDRAAGR